MTFNEAVKKIKSEHIYPGDVFDIFGITNIENQCYGIINGEYHIMTNDNDWEFVDVPLTDTDLEFKNDQAIINITRGLNKISNVVRTDGTLLSDEWFTVVRRIKDRRNYQVWNDDYKTNIMDRYGDIMLDTWVDGFDPFNGMIGFVWLDGKHNLIYRNYEFVSKMWFDKISEPTEAAPCLAFVENYNGKIGYLDIMDGTLVGDQLFDEIRGRMEDGMVTLISGNKKIIIDNTGDIIG